MDFKVSADIGLKQVLCFETLRHTNRVLKAYSEAMGDEAWENTNIF